MPSKSRKKIKTSEAEAVKAEEEEEGVTYEKENSMNTSGDGSGGSKRGRRKKAESDDDEDHMENNEGVGEEEDDDDEGGSSPKRSKKKGVNKAAVSSPMTDRHTNPTGKPAEAGIIKEVYVENFMCHRKMTVKLCRNVNFIHGQNGSGKSAILAAIQVCLGAGARRTHRARNLKGKS